MEIKVYELKAFCNGEKGGNRLGAIIDKVPNNLKQKTAKILGYSETVFIERKEERQFKFEYFTPNNQVDLCGHATIGGFHLLKTLYSLDGRYNFYNDEIDLEIEINEKTIMMEQKKAKFIEMKIDKKRIAESLNIDLDKFNGEEIEIVSTGLRDMLIEIKSLEILKSMKPNLT